MLRPVPQPKSLEFCTWGFGDGASVMISLGRREQSWTGTHRLLGGYRCLDNRLRAVLVHLNHGMLYN